MLVDTSIWIEAFAEPDTPSRQRLDTVLADHQPIVGDLILVELLQGLREGPRLRLVEAALGSLRVVTLCGPEIAPLAAANYRSLRRRGITVRGTIDVIIATWCIHNRVALLHNDRDFDTIEEHLGLVVWR